MERTRRPNQVSLRAGPQSLRLQLRLWRCYRRQSVRRGAIGSETDGSVTSPSSINGLVGIKPTVGLVSRSGIIPISASQDTAGPMARTVRDVAILLSVMAGVDPQDPATAASQSKAAPDYTRFLDPNGLRGARLGIARKFFENNAPMDAFLNGCIDALKKAGAEVIDPADLATMDKWTPPKARSCSTNSRTGSIAISRGFPPPAPHARSRS